MRPQPTRQFIGAVALAIAVSLGPLACDSSDTATGPEGPPRLTVLFGAVNTLPATSGGAALFANDEIVPTEVWLKVEDVCLQGVGDGDHEGDQNGRQCVQDENTKGWIEVVGPTAGWETLVEGAEVPPGAHQLRFIITGAVLVADGTVYGTPGVEEPPNDLSPTDVLHCPSCAQSGLKVIFPDGEPTITEGENILVAQFNVADSFGKERGNSGRWVMHPVIRGSLNSMAQLVVAVTGDGKVTSSPPGIDCGTDCTENFPVGEPVQVTLTAETAVDGWSFAAWGGDCSGEEATTTVVMDSNKSCSATFEQSGGGGSP